MTQRLLSAGILLLTIITGYLSWQAQQHRIAYVDSPKLLNGYQAMLDARKDYAIKSRTWQANVDTLSAGVQRAIRDYERKANAMTPKERNLSTELLHAKQRELINYQRAIQESAQQEDDKSTRLVVTEVNAFLERYGKAHGYELILVATPSGSIAYAKAGLDLTAEVVAQLNKEYVKHTK
jgi:outer membrane protein